MNRLRILLPLTLLTLFLAGCREDLDLTDVRVEQEPPVVTEGTAGISGKVISSTGNPMSGVTVELIGIGQVTVSDEEGRYVFSEAPLLPTGVTLFFNDGFSPPQFRSITAKDDSHHYLNVTMEEFPFTGVVSANEGGRLVADVSGFQVVSINVPPGTARDNGQPYTGNLEIAIDYRDATDPTQMYQSGNNLPANDPLREKAELESYGLAQIRITGDSGQPITFDSIGPTLEFPYPRFINAIERDSLLPWQLSPTGWERMPANADRNVSEELLELEIFAGGSYNWAIPFSSIIINGRLFSESGVPQPFTNFYVAIDNGGIVYAARTGVDGSFCAPAPQDQPLEIYYNRSCELGVIFSLFFDEIGPFSTATSLGDVAKPLNSIAFDAFTGDCVTNTINQTDDLIVYVDGQPRGELIRNPDGSVTVWAGDCNEDGVVQIQTVNANNPFETSGVETRNLMNTDPLTLITCSELVDGEFLSIQFGSEDTTATSGSFLLLREEGEDFRQRVSYRGGNPQVSSSFELVLTFPYGGSGSYFAPEASVELLEFIDEEPGFTYRCPNNCESLVINVDSATADDPLLIGSFNYAAEKVNILTDEVVETDVPVSGSFAILR